MHPSGFMHLIFAQYMQSVFNAMISSISKQLANFNNNSEDYLFNQLSVLKSQNNKFIPFVGLSGNITYFGNPYDYDSKNTHTNSLNLGAYYSINNYLLVGTMLNISTGNYHPFNNFKYKYNHQIINLFSKFNLNNNWWISTNINVGKINAHDISRIIELGLGENIENSNTHGKSIGINITSAYMLQYTPSITLIPYINLNLHNYKIHDFAEKK